MKQRESRNQKSYQGCIQFPVRARLHSDSGQVIHTLTGVTVSGNGISWAICKSASRSRQIIMPVPTTQVFYWSDTLTPNQQCQSTEGISKQLDINNDNVTDALAPYLWSPQSTSWHVTTIYRNADMHCAMGPHGFGKTFLHNNNSNNSNHRVSRQNI